VASVQILGRPLAGNGGDVFVNTHSINVQLGRLQPGQTRTVPVVVQFPADTPTGSELLVASVNAGNSLVEMNQMNNVAVSSLPVDIVTGPASVSNGFLPVPTNPFGGNSMSGVSVGSFVPVGSNATTTVSNVAIPIVGTTSPIIGNAPTNSIGNSPTSAVGLPVSGISGLVFLSPNDGFTLITSPGVITSGTIGGFVPGAI